MDKLCNTVFKTTTVLVVFFVFCGQVTHVAAQAELVDDGASKEGYLEGVPLERIVDSDVVQVLSDPNDDNSPKVEAVKIDYISDTKPEILSNEILDARTPNSQTFDNRNGTYTLKYYLADVFITDGLEWRYLDSKYTTQEKFDTAFEIVPETSFFETLEVHAATTSSLVADDSRLVQNAATTNYGSEEESVIQSKDASRNHRQIYRVTMPGGTGTITDVSIYFKNTYSENNGGAGNLEIHELTQTEWVEDQCTWNNYNTGSAWSSSGGDYSSTIVDYIAYLGDAETWYSFDLMGGAAENPIELEWSEEVNLLAKWQTESSSSGGTYMRPYLSEASTASNRPYLLITYTSEEEPPEEPIATTTVNELIVDMPYTQELTMITAMTVIYGTTTGTTTPLAIEYTYYHIPLIAWLIVAYLLINSFWFIYAHVKDYDRRS